MPKFGPRSIERLGNCTRNMVIKMIKKMKKTLLFTTAIAMCFAVSCAEFEDDMNVNSGEGMTVTASLEEITRTHLDGVSMYWKQSDAINVAIDPAVSSKPYSVTLDRFDLQSGADTKSAVFKSETASPGNVYHAAYPATSYVKEGERYIFFDFPYEQEYVENGIKDGYVPMYAYGVDDPSKLSFMYGSGIVRLNLYDAQSANPVSISKIEVITDQPASGLMVASLNLNRFPAYRMNTNKQYTITYDVPDVVLSKDQTQPTSFNICLANTISNGAKLLTDGVYASVTFKVYASDGSVFTKTKQNQTIEGGKIYDFPALQYEGAVTYKVGDYYPNPSVDVNDPEEVAKVEGIVFAVSEDGKSGKVFSKFEVTGYQWSLSGTVDNTDDADDGSVNTAAVAALESVDLNTIQYPVFDYCAGLGNGWYVPAVNELVAIHTLRGDLSIHKNALNTKLTEVGGTGFSEVLYYSSTEFESSRNKAYAVNFKRASTASDLKQGALKTAADGYKFRFVKKFGNN